jgi:hypothetical protein
MMASRLKYSTVYVFPSAAVVAKNATTELRASSRALMATQRKTLLKNTCEMPR